MIYALLALSLVLGIATGVQTYRVGHLQTKIEAKDQALGAARSALSSAAIAIREQNAAALVSLEAAKAQLKAAEQASGVLERAKAQAEKRAAGDRDRWNQAKASKPGCAELLASDLMLTCGVMPR